MLLKFAALQEVVWRICGREIGAGEERLCGKLSGIANVASEAALVSAQTLDLDYRKGASSVPRLWYQPHLRP